MIKAILLGLAVGCDAFACAFAYGAKKMKIPISGSLIIAFLGAAVLGVSLAVGAVAEGSLPQDITSLIVGSFLSILGFVSSLLALFRIRLRDRSKIYFKKICGITVRLGFSLHEESPRELASLKESAALGISLSLDSLATGLAVGMTISAAEMLVALVLAFAGGLAFQLAGVKLGARLAAKTTADLSYISGLVLLILGMIVVIGE